MPAAGAGGLGTVPVRADWCGIPPSAHMLPTLVAEKDMYAAAARAAGIAVIDDMTEFTQQPCWRFGVVPRN